MIIESLRFKLSQNRTAAFFLTAAVLFIVFSDITAGADEVKLKNDQTFIGRITKEAIDGVWLEISRGAEVFFHISQIKSIKKPPIEDRKDIKAQDRTAETKEDTHTKHEEERSGAKEDKSEEIKDYFRKITEITEKCTRAANEYNANAKKAVEGLTNNEVDLEGFVYIVQIEEKKRLRMDAMLLDEFKSMKPVPSRFEKSHALLIESMGEEIKARTSNIAGDKEAARQHNLRALECAKQYAEEAGEGLKGAMKDYVDKLVSQDG